MIRYLFLTATILTMSLFSCKPEITIPTKRETITKPPGLELVWQIPLKENDIYTVYNRVTLLDEHIAFQYDYTGNEKVLFVNKSDTSTTRFTGEISGNVKKTYFHPEAGLILIDYKNVFVGKDASSMRILYSAPPCTQFGIENNLIDDFIYLGSVRNDCKNESYVLKTNVFSGETIIDKVQKDSDFPGVGYMNSNEIEAPCLFTTPQNDSLLMYLHFLNIHGIPYVTSKIFHKQRNELLWIDSTFLGLNRNRFYVDYNGKLICVGSNMTMLEPLTGEKYWETEPIASRPWKSWTPVNLNLIENKLCFLEQGHYVEMDPNSGAILYDSPTIYSGETASTTTYFDGVLYFTAGHKGLSWIYGIRVSDRKVVLKMRSPNSGKPPYYNDTNYSTNGITIDPETRLAYTADGFFAQCFRIPESYD